MDDCKNFDPALEGFKLTLKQQWHQSKYVRNLPWRILTPDSTDSILPSFYAEEWYTYYGCNWFAMHERGTDPGNEK